MSKDPHMRNVFDIMTEEEMQKFYGPDGVPNTGDETLKRGGEQSQEQGEQETEIKDNGEGEEEKVVQKTKTEAPAEKTQQTPPEQDSQAEEQIRNMFK